MSVTAGNESDPVAVLLAQRDAAIRERDELRAVLAPLLADPWRGLWSYSEPDATCVFCGESDLGSGHPFGGQMHATDCPVLRHAALLGEQEGP